ncbi:3-dehydroquinate synthase [Corynebacterium sp. CCM 9185]|uniref:3-dehydroquinate synthase n=1 Tax=Corynebacterium marambiense TaxID=2765364 RepID=A0ABS0VZ01_9CORY|nr:3-dehydroquinate synthase [Corynebacterium marambiense]MBI9000552.1 3-dehydroquinate synthase [Corynebacterium marambiense]MCK7663185.1 3-dehydroquinate synthase [Corynebacterium marambiense]MCX7542799.1 3-dehydroquinate synthase [Corynebacterium marambiense]
MSTSGTFESTISVAGPAPYTVWIGHGLDSAIAGFASGLPGARKAAILHQGVLGGVAEGLTEALSTAGLEVVRHVIPDAEAGKTLQSAGECWDALGRAGLGRRDVVIGLGGGAATDLAGFIAATWMRGVPVIQVPTTLLAMVDAAVGGKTGINTAAGKNLVGCFHEPAAVFIDLDRLGTLPMDEIVAGSAEIIKTGFIADPEILARYESEPEACLRVDGHLPELIARSVAVKARVVSEDLQEAGLREILNYGHTFGHAVELREHFAWRHGRAVAVGMMFIAELSRELGHIDAGLVDRHRRILTSVGLPTSYSAGCFDELHAGMTRDKKNRDGRIRFVALTDVGSTTRLEGPSMDSLRAAYAAISG